MALVNGRAYHEHRAPDRLLIGSTGGGFALCWCLFAAHSGKCSERRRRDIVSATQQGEVHMGWPLMLLILIIVIVVFGLGFVVKALFWVALVLFILWIIYVIVNSFRRR